MPETPAARTDPRTAPRPDPRVVRSRRAVLDAALAELAARGYGAFTIDGVATRAGVARSTIYRLWPDRAAPIAQSTRRGASPRDWTPPTRASVSVPSVNASPTGSLSRIRTSAALSPAATARSGCMEELY